MAPPPVVLSGKKCFRIAFDSCSEMSMQGAMNLKVTKKLQPVSVLILLIIPCPFPLYCEVPALLKVSCCLNYSVHDVTMNQRLKVSLLFSKAYQNRERLLAFALEELIMQSPLKSVHKMKNIHGGF